MPDRDPYLFTGPSRLGPAALPPLSDPGPRLPFGALKASPDFAPDYCAVAVAFCPDTGGYFGLIAFILIAIAARCRRVRAGRGGQGPGGRTNPRRRAVGQEQTASIFPVELDAYLKDRFGFRKEMIRLALQVDNLSSNHGNENGRVLIGRDGRMYAEQNDAVRQSAGLVMRDRMVRGTAEYLDGEAGTYWRSAGSGSWLSRCPQIRRRSIRKSSRHGRATRERRPSTTCFSRSLRSEASAPSTCGLCFAQQRGKAENLLLKTSRHAFKRYTRSLERRSTRSWRRMGILTGV